MNQILQTTSDDKNYNNISNINTKKRISKIFYFKIIFFCCLLSIITITIIKNIKLHAKENHSAEIINNYNITRLYSNMFTETKNNIQNANNNLNKNIIGIIEIPKINVYYPVFSNYSEDLLKISPCKFYGSYPGEKSNLCIAGHNYDNDKFFSKINNLTINDHIILYDFSNNKYLYKVQKKYEVNPNDLSPLYNYEENTSQLTLLTCNNFNKNRIVIHALLNFFP